MTHPDTLTIPRAVVEHALESLLEGVAWREGGRQKASAAIDNLRAALQPQAAAEPVNRTDMTYYKNNACKAENAMAADCICWTPQPQATPPATQALQEEIDRLTDVLSDPLLFYKAACVERDMFKDRIEATQAALTAALESLKKIQLRPWHSQVRAIAGYAIAQIEALKGPQ